MKQISEYSDQELMEIASGKPVQTPGNGQDLSGYSDEELSKIAGVELPAPPEYPVTSTPEAMMTEFPAPGPPRPPPPGPVAPPPPPDLPLGPPTDVRGIAPPARPPGIYSFDPSTAPGKLSDIPRTLGRTAMGFALFPVDVAVGISAQGAGRAGAFEGFPGADRPTSQYGVTNTDKKAAQYVREAYSEALYGNPEEIGSEGLVQKLFGEVTPRGEAAESTALYPLVIINKPAEVAEHYVEQITGDPLVAKMVGAGVLIGTFKAIHVGKRLGMEYLPSESKRQANLTARAVAKFHWDVNKSELQNTIDLEGAVRDVLIQDLEDRVSRRINLAQNKEARQIVEDAKIDIQTRMQEIVRQHMADYYSRELEGGVGDLVEGRFQAGQEAQAKALQEQRYLEWAKETTRRNGQAKNLGQGLEEFIKTMEADQAEKTREAILDRAWLGEEIPQEPGLEEAYLAGQAGYAWRLLQEKDARIGAFPKPQPAKLGEPIPSGGKVHPGWLLPMPEIPEAEKAFPRPQPAELGKPIPMGGRIGGPEGEPPAAPPSAEPSGVPPSPEAGAPPPRVIPPGKSSLKERIQEKVSGKGKVSVPEGLKEFFYREFTRGRGGPEWTTNSALEELRRKVRVGAFDAIRARTPEENLQALDAYTGEMIDRMEKDAAAEGAPPEVEAPPAPPLKEKIKKKLSKREVSNAEREKRREEMEKVREEAKTRPDYISEEVYKASEMKLDQLLENTDAGEMPLEEVKRRHKAILQRVIDVGGYIDPEILKDYPDLKNPEVRPFSPGEDRTPPESETGMWGTWRARDDLHDARVRATIENGRAEGKGYQQIMEEAWSADEGRSILSAANKELEAALRESGLPWLKGHGQDLVARRGKEKGGRSPWVGLNVYFRGENKPPAGIKLGKYLPDAKLEDVIKVIVPEEKKPKVQALYDDYKKMHDAWEENYKKGEIWKEAPKREKTTEEVQKDLEEVGKRIREEYDKKRLPPTPAAPEPEKKSLRERVQEKLEKQKQDLEGQPEEKKAEGDAEIPWWSAGDQVEVYGGGDLWEPGIIRSVTSSGKFRVETTGGKAKGLIADYTTKDIRVPQKPIEIPEEIGRRETTDERDKKKSKKDQKIDAQLAKIHLKIGDVVEFPLYERSKKWKKGTVVGILQRPTDGKIFPRIQISDTYPSRMAEPALYGWRKLEEKAKPGQEKVKPVEEPVDTPQEVVDEATDAAREEGIPLKDQKKYIISALEKAKKGARNEQDANKKLTDAFNNWRTAQAELRGVESGIYEAKKDADISKSLQGKEGISEEKIGKRIEGHDRKLADFESQLKTKQGKVKAMEEIAIRSGAIVRLHIPGDGTFLVKNTIQALTQFEKLVKAKFPSGPDKGFKGESYPSVSKGGREAKAPKELKDAAKVEGGGYTTNGHILLKGNFPAKFDEGRGEVKKAGVEEVLKRTPDLKQLTEGKVAGFIVTGEGKESGEFSGISDKPIPGIEDTEKAVVRFDVPGLGEVHIDQQYYLFAKEHYPDAKFHFTDDASNQAAISSRGKIVGAVMPLNFKHQEMRGISEVRRPGEAVPPEYGEAKARQAKLEADKKDLIEDINRWESQRIPGPKPAQALRERLEELVKEHGEEDFVGIRNLIDHTEEVIASKSTAKKDRESWPTGEAKEVEPTGPKNKTEEIELQMAIIPGLKEFAEGDVIPAIERAAETLADAKDDILATFNPKARSEEAKRSAVLLRQASTEILHSSDRARYALRVARTVLARRSFDENVDFIGRIEEGIPQADPTLQGIADAMRKLLDDRRKAVQALGTGKLSNFYQTYFPHIWQRPQKYLDWYRKVFSRRPMEGPKSFLKKRTHPTFKEALDAGLKPVSDNPVDLVILKIREMDRYITAHRALNQHKAEGMARFVHVFAKAPEGWRKIDDPIGVVYGPPEITVPEAFDERLMEQAQRFAKAIGVKHERLAKIPRVQSKTWGVSYQGQSLIRSRFAGPESVIFHEIGHQLDVKYDLWSKLFEAPPAEHTFDLKTKKGQREYRVALENELRAVADLRFEGKQVGEGFKRYTRQKSEKLAAVLESYYGAPHKLGEVAPNIFRNLRKFFQDNPNLKEFEVPDRSIVLGSDTRQFPVGGLVIKGHYYAPEPVARLFNNYLSPGLRNKSGAFRAYLGAANVLNQWQLGLSAFHLGFTSFDAMTSKFALGLHKSVIGDLPGAIRAFGEVPFAPVTGAIKGHKILKEWYEPGTQGTEMAAIVDALKKAGGQALQDPYYHTQIAQRMMDAFRKGNVLGGAIRLPFALVEQAAKPVLEWIVPRQKLAVFYDLAKHEIERLGPGADSKTVEAAMAKIWDSAENRMGQIKYDNLFWNRVAKDLGMASIRSLGWNLGTFREIGGGAIDAGAQLAKIARWEKPELTYRMAYTISLPIMVGTVGAVIQYLYTGQGPQELKDYFFPRTGVLDQRGRPERVSLPSYMKDLYHYYERPGRTMVNKLHPMLNLIAEQLQNEDFYGTEIYNADDPFLQQMVDRAKHTVGTFEPFSFRGARRIAEFGGEAREIVLPFVGITPAPGDINKTEAEKKASQYLRDRIPVGSRTKEEAEASRRRYKLIRGLRLGEPDASRKVEESVRAGEITRRQAREIRRASKRDSLVNDFKKLSYQEALRVYEAASDEEKAKLGTILRKKRRTFRRNRPIMERMAVDEEFGKIQ